MKTAFTLVATILLSGCTGCMWPAATYVHGKATVTQPIASQPSSLPATKADKSIRIIVLKYWRVQELFSNGPNRFEFFGGQAADQSEFPVSFPLRIYPAVWTPVLGAQHLLPGAGLIVFAQGYWPCHVIADDNRRCCEAPSTGERHWHIALQPMDRAPACAPPAKGWRSSEEFPPLTMDELDTLLRWNWTLTQADREMCRRQLVRLLQWQRQNASHPSPNP